MCPRKLPGLVVILAFCFVLLACKKGGGDGGNTGPVPVPILIMQNSTQTRNATTTIMMTFSLTLSKAATNAATVDYTFQDGTATSPKDYTATSGTATIAANQTSTTIEVPIKSDPNDTRQPNMEFTLQLSNPKNCALGVLSAKGTILTEDGMNLTTENTGYSSPLTYPGYTLAWNDEFTGNTLNTNFWSMETGNGSNGWGNNELEYYTNSTRNAFVSNGNLIIEARKQSIDKFNYSSARMNTANKKTFKFGRIDIRAKLPVSKGIWPALWMLGSNISTVPWPGCGEMDIMELIGTYPSRYYSTMHWKAASGSHASKGGEYNLPTGNFSQQFHVFSIVWTEDMIKSYIDDQLVLTTTSTDVGAPNYPFNAPEFLIFNVAVGGDWPGAPDANTVFPQRMFVDYVRVFQ